MPSVPRLELVCTMQTPSPSLLIPLTLAAVALSAAIVNNLSLDDSFLSLSVNQLDEARAARLHAVKT